MLLLQEWADPDNLRAVNCYSVLVRFFARDLTQLVIKRRTALKGSVIVIYEDCTLLTRRLLRTVKDTPNVESAWTQNGVVWAKPEGRNSKKVRFVLGDDISKKVEGSIHKARNNRSTPNDQTRRPLDNSSQQPIRPPRANRSTRNNTLDNLSSFGNATASPILDQAATSFNLEGG